MLLLSTAIAAFAVFGTPDDVFLEPMRDAVTRRGAPVEITSSPEVIVRWGRGMAMLGTIATHPVIAFVLAGLLTAVFSVFGRGRGSFMEYLSLTSHALLIPALGTLLMLAVTLLLRATGSGDPFTWFQPEAGSGGKALSFLFSIDPFVVWMLVVMGIGVSGFDGQRRAGTAVGVLMGGYLLFLLVAGIFLLG
jgi:hypothetical protein